MANLEHADKSSPSANSVGGLHADTNMEKAWEEHGRMALGNKRSLEEDDVSRM